MTTQLEEMYAELDAIDYTLQWTDAEMAKLRPTVMAYRAAKDRNQRVTEPTKTLQRYDVLYSERADAAHKRGPLVTRIGEQEGTARRARWNIAELDKEIAKLNALDYRDNPRLEARRKEELANCERRRAGYVASLQVIGTPRGLEELVIAEAV